MPDEPDVHGDVLARIDFAEVVEVVLQQLALAQRNEQMSLPVEIEA